MSKYTIGLDYGTNSVRALIVSTDTGEEIGTSVWNYTHGEAGVFLDLKNPLLARQHPIDYLDGTIASIRGAIKKAAFHKNFSVKDIIGIGVATTGSTPLPLDQSGIALALHREFKNNPNAMAWLWKDHTGFEEAAEITELASKIRPNYLSKCGSIYSSEWFWSKILHCLHTDPKVFKAAYTWVEIADWIPACLTGTTNPAILKRGICAAGHKAMFHHDWNGYPDEEFLTTLDKRMVRIRKSLPSKAYTVAESTGGLSSEWAIKLGLKPGIPVAVGNFDAHAGGVGSGIQPGDLVKIIGTSTCDMMVVPLKEALPDIPGLCGIVPESILPGYYGLEAGQSAVGDIFNWFVNYIQPCGTAQGSHIELTKKAEKLKPGESGLLALDWHNGNRTILVDQRLSGLAVGLTLQTTPAEIYRAWIESTAYGARRIMERFEEYGVKVKRVINCGGISVKNPLVMQIYADVMNRPIHVSRSAQTCAMGAAIAGAVVAGKRNGGYDSFNPAVKAMTGVMKQKFMPVKENARIYNRLYQMYQCLHNNFGIKGYMATNTNKPKLYDIMKELLTIRDSIR